MRDGATAFFTPPIPLGFGRNEHAEVALPFLIPHLDRNAVGVAVARLCFVNIETGWKEEDGFAVSRLQGLIDVGGDPRPTG